MGGLRAAMIHVRFIRSSQEWIAAGGRHFALISNQIAVCWKRSARDQEKVCCKRKAVYHQPKNSAVDREPFVFDWEKLVLHRKLIFPDGGKFFADREQFFSIEERFLWSWNDFLRIENHFFWIDKNLIAVEKSLFSIKNRSSDGKDGMRLIQMMLLPSSFDGP